MNLSLTTADGSILSCIGVHLNCFSTDPGQIFSNKLNSLEEPLWSKPSTAVLRKSHRTGRCLASQICNKQTIFYQMFPSKIRAIMNLVFKGNKCRIIQMDASDYKGLKSETIDNNKL